MAARRRHRETLRVPVGDADAAARSVDDAQHAIATAGVAAPASRGQHNGGHCSLNPSTRLSAAGSAWSADMSASPASHRSMACRSASLRAPPAPWRETIHPRDVVPSPLSRQVPDGSANALSAANIHQNGRATHSVGDVPHLAWVHGYRGHDCRNNVHFSADGDAVYPAASVVVLAGVAPEGGRRRQRFYTDHTDDVLSLAPHPKRQVSCLRAPFHGKFFARLRPCMGCAS